MIKQNPKDICASKIAYENESMVQNILFIENRIGNRDYYKCNLCNKYHVFKLNNNAKRFDKKFNKELALINDIKKRKKAKPKYTDRKKYKK